MSNYSIYIPRVFNNISNQKIINAFEKYELGTISSIDVKRKTGLDGSCYKVVFIHFSHWNEDNSSAINLRERIENPEKEAKLMYDDPWYWILLPNTSAWQEVTENIYQPQMSLQACYDRISNMEDELTKIYGELHRKSYIPINYSDCMENNDIESCSPSSSSVAPSNMSPMTIDELMVDVEQSHDDGQLHKPPTPTLNNNLSRMSCEYDYEYDIESGCSLVDYESVSSIENKRWMTAHFCGND